MHINILSTVKYALNKKDLRTSVGQIQPQLQYSRPLLPTQAHWKYAIFSYISAKCEICCLLHFTRLFRGQVHKRRSRQYNVFSIADAGLLNSQVS